MHLNERLAETGTLHTLGWANRLPPTILLFFMFSAPTACPATVDGGAVRIAAVLFLGYDHIALAVVSVSRVGLGRLDSFLGQRRSIRLGPLPIKQA